MYRIYLSNLDRWIENVPAEEAIVYLEEGYIVERMN